MKKQIETSRFKQEQKVAHTSKWKQAVAYTSKWKQTERDMQTELTNMSELKQTESYDIQRRKWMTIEQ